MENNKAKQEAIRKAYGVYWDKMSPELQAIALQSDGWIQMRDCIKELGEEFSCSDDLETESIEYAVFKQRPISIQGIENNNNWIRIESKDDLPKDLTECYVYDDDGDITYFTFGIHEANEFMYLREQGITHYQPIVKPEKPIY